MIKTTNELIYDRFVRHQTRMLQYSAGLSRKAAKLLEDTEDELTKIILFYAAKLEGSDLSDKKAKKMLGKMVIDIETLRTPAWTAIGDLVGREMEQLLIDEANLAQTVIKDALYVDVDVTGLLDSDAKRISRDTPYRGKVTKDWIKYNAVADRSRLSDAAIIGIKERATATQVMRRVMGTQSQNYKDGIARRSWTDAETLAYTASSMVQDQAKATVARANPFIITKEYFVATLDGGTTPICMSLDGNVYDLTSGPNPPLHFRCRSLRLPYITPESISNRNFTATTESMILREYADQAGIKNVPRSQLPRGHKTLYDAYARKRKNQLTGRLPEKIDYSEFLRRQRREFVEEKLGIERARAFLSGDEHISKYVNRRGSFYTLEELRNKGMLDSVSQI